MAKIRFTARVTFVPVRAKVSTSLLTNLLNAEQLLHHLKKENEEKAPETRRLAHPYSFTISVLPNSLLHCDSQCCEATYEENHVYSIRRNGVMVQCSSSFKSLRQEGGNGTCSDQGQWYNIWVMQPSMPATASSSQ
ncbi:hypothetical protein BT69DRAFT_163544 [Atractiella rhizophila]|nr:hypothetical protein BT69DRAFT_163544 [Atractiella rhizophila]